MRQTGMGRRWVCYRLTDWPQPGAPLRSPGDSGAPSRTVAMS